VKLLQILRSSYLNAKGIGSKTIGRKKEMQSTKEFPDWHPGTRTQIEKPH